MKTRADKHPVKTLFWMGLTLAVERLAGESYPWTAPDGSSGNTRYTLDYGYFPGTKGLDGDALDFFYQPHEGHVDFVFVIDQVTPAERQQKCMIGFRTADEAVKAFLQHKPAHMLGEVIAVPCAEFVEAIREASTDLPIEFCEEEPPSSVEMTEDALRAYCDELGIEITRADGEVTNFPKKGDNKTVSLRNSQWKVFDPAFMADVRDNYPALWKKGGNIRGNDQFRKLLPIARRGGSVKTKAEENAVRLREAWVARHYEDHEVPGVVAQGKWLAVGTLGEARMKALLNEEKKKEREDERAEGGQEGQRHAGGGGAQGVHVRRGPEAQGESALHVRAAEVRAVRAASREVDAVASTQAVDSHGTILRPNWDLRRFVGPTANPVLLWQHNRTADLLPVGHCKNLRVVDGQLHFTAVFDDTTEFDRQVFEKYAKGVLRAFSVGFAARDAWVEVIDGEEVVILDGLELHEISCVCVPSNHEALVKQRTALLAIARRGAVPYEGYKPVDDDSWDGDAAEKEIRAWATKDGEVDWKAYREGFAWYDAAEPEKFESYKLPHHRVRNGALVTSRRGVMAAGAALQGARGGVKIPDGQVAAVKAHLAKHYEQFDLTPPWEEPRAALPAADRSHGDDMKEMKVKMGDGGQCVATCAACGAEGMLPKGMMMPERAVAVDNEVRESMALLKAERARGDALEKQIAEMQNEVRKAQLDNLKRDLDALVGTKIAPAQVATELELLEVYLGNRQANTGDDKDKFATVGESKIAKRFAALQALPDMGIQGVRIAHINNGPPGEQTAPGSRGEGKVRSVEGVSVTTGGGKTITMTDTSLAELAAAIDDE